MRRQKHEDGDMVIEGVHEPETEQYWDDLSGKPLIPELVNKARLEELGEIAKHGVRKGTSERVLECNR